MDGSNRSCFSHEPLSRRRRLAPVVAAAGLCGFALLFAAGAWAQGDGPRSQLPMPVGTNVLAPTYLHLSMNSDFSQSILIVDTRVKADILLGVYTRSLSVGGRYAQLWVVPSGGELRAGATVGRAGGGSIERRVSESGWGDPYVAFRIGLVGAPGLELAEFMKHKPTFQVYAYGGVYVPLGDYDSDRRLNLGTNRWALRLGLPLVVPIGNPRTQTFLEIHPGVTLYADNHDPTGGAGTKEQAPLWQVESHLSTNFTAKWWGSVGLRYRNGGETRTDGVKDGNKQDVLGGEVTLGYAFTPHLGLQSTYGNVLNESDGSKSDMLRVRLTYAF